MKLLDHLWRLFGTALCFSVFGLAGLIIGFVLFPLMFLFIRDAHVRHVKARRLIGAAFGAFVWLLSSVRVLTYEIQGTENIAPGRSQLIIANHPTLIDVVFLLSIFPQSDCVIKKAVTRNPFMRSTVAAANYISNSEPEDLLDSCVARLESGGSLLLFPEGTRSIRGQDLHFKPGAAAVAARANAEILPIVITCEPGFLGKEDPWYKVPRGRPHFIIRIMPATAAAQLVPSEHDQRELRRSLHEAILTLINHELA
jgi:1-acyl-sn-glycerol-3-phosphate acyltransferase